MEYLGRIITKNTKDAESRALDFIEILKPSDSIDKSIPTLIVGKTIAQDIYGKDRIKVLDKNIEENVSWTYAKNERRNEYEKDIDRFNKSLYRNILRKISYQFYSILEGRLSDIKNIIMYLESGKEKFFYITEKHIYMLKGDKVIGFSFDEMEYIGIDREKVISFIRQNPFHEVIENSDFLSEKMQVFIGENNIVVPYLYFIGD